MKKSKTKIKAKKKTKIKKIQKIIEAVLLVGDKSICDELKLIIENAELKILSLKNIDARSIRKYDLLCAIEITNLDIEEKRKNLSAIDRIIPKSVSIISSSICETVASQSRFVKSREKLIGFCAFPTLLSNNLIEIAPSLRTSKLVVEKTREFFAKLGKNSIVVQDRIGLVLPRIISQIINEAFFAIQQNIATPSDIDLAMKLGTNYPHGPIEWGEKIGFEQVGAVLKALFDETREERYKISPLLTQLIYSKN